MRPVHLRRLVRLRLITVFALLTILCVVLGRAATTARTQRNVVETIRSNGGEVYYDFEYTSNEKYLNNTALFIPVDDTATPPSPEWLRRFIGIDYLSSVAVVTLTEDASRVHSKDIDFVRQLSDLEVLSLRFLPITDLSPVADAQKLERLCLVDLPVKDLEPLSGLSELKTLYIHDLPSGDLSPLRKLNKLRVLSLNFDGSAVSDLTDISCLKSLESLEIRVAAGTDLQPLASLPKLKQLRIHGARVSDEEIAALRKSGLREACNVQYDRPITVLDWVGDFALYLIRTYDRTTDQLAALQVATMLIRYMDMNEGRWPSCWEDLRGVYASVALGRADDHAFRRLQERVWINFNLVRWEGFLQLLSARETTFFGIDVNDRMLEYRRERWGQNERDNEVWELGH